MGRHRSDPLPIAIGRRGVSPAQDGGLRATR